MTAINTTISIDLTDLDSIADAVLSGITTIQQVADYLGIDLVEDCLVLPGTPITADDGNAPIEYEDMTAEEAAEEYVSGGDWGEENETKWIDVRTWQDGLDEDGDTVRVGAEKHTITIEATEPECLDGDEHVWNTPHSILGGLKENPGCWGHGGGVICHEVCMRCGCQKTTDSWAQNPSNGQQGLRSTEYTEGKYTDEVAEAHLAEAVDDLGATLIEGEYHYEQDGTAYIAESDAMIEYGRAKLCGDDADLPGNEVEADYAE